MRRAALLGCLGLSLWGAPAVAAPRVMSLDQCADQFVLALSPRATIVGLSTRARSDDSYLRAQASGLPLRRADIESALAARPQVVVRYWGGAPALLDSLRRRGARIVSIDDAVDFPGVIANVRKVASALGQGAAGEHLVAGMTSNLTRAAGAWGGQAAIYLTPGGGTAGGGTLIDAMFRAAGLHNLADGQGFREVSLERLVAHPPAAVVEGFFDAGALSRQPWTLGRHGALTWVLRGRRLVSVPGSMLGCPAWFAADAAWAMAERAPRSGISHP